MSVAPNEVCLKVEGRSSSEAYLKPAMPAVLKGTTFPVLEADGQSSKRLEVHDEV